MNDQHYVKPWTSNTNKQAKSNIHDRELGHTFFNVKRVQSDIPTLKKLKTTVRLVRTRLVPTWTNYKDSIEPARLYGLPNKYYESQRSWYRVCVFFNTTRLTKAILLSPELSYGSVQRPPQDGKQFNKNNKVAETTSVCSL